jgi:predicted DCC family thiol-disulfide oxidoreductase YuxK
VSHGWTGGQYSVFRALFGAYLFVHFAALLPFGAEVFSNAGMLPHADASPLYPLFPSVLFVADGPAVVVGLLAVAALASLAFALGFRDRSAALLLWYVWACLFTRNPLISNPGLPFVGWLLLAHACLPPRPFGAWDARGRLDPDAGWTSPAAVYTAAWVVMAVGYSYSGLTKLASPSWLDGSALAQVLGNPLARPTFLRETLLALPAPVIAAATWGALAAEILFAPLALFSRIRPWVWLALLSMHLGLMTLIDFADLSAGMVALHGFTFDPAWIRRRAPQGHTVVFYDGSCGLCHRTVRFLLAEDAAGERFRFAPLDGARFAAARAEEVGALSDAGDMDADETDADDIPDSVLVKRPGEAMLTRAEGVLEIGHQLGGLWRILASVVGLVPLPLLNLGYDFVARVRHRLFARPDAACPVLPPSLRERFEP